VYSNRRRVSDRMTDRMAVCVGRDSIYERRDLTASAGVSAGKRGISKGRPHEYWKGKTSCHIYLRGIYQLLNLDGYLVHRLHSTIEHQKHFRSVRG
jgi:hypothetical protein